MNKKKRIVWISISLCIVLLFSIFTFAGNYLVNTSISNKALHKGSSDTTSQMVSTGQTLFTPTYIKSDDGLKLYGRVYKTFEPTSKWAITIHGHGRDSAYIQDISQAFLNNGFNVLAPDMRAHGNSEGAYSGMGWLERKDVLNWIDYIIKQDPNAEIVLYGISMGGATVMMTSGEQLPPNVKCGIEDCGYTSVYDEFSYQFSQRYPYLPKTPLFNFAEGISNIKAGYTFGEASSLDQLKKCTIPMLFIHGDKDTYVPFDMLQKVYDADANLNKQMLVIEGAEHADSYKVNPTLYWDTVFQFTEKYE